MTIASLVRRWGLLALGVVMLVVVAVMASQPVTYGWFAYAPLSSTSFAQFPVAFVSTGTAVVLGVGVALVAGWVGYRLGIRAKPAAPQFPEQ